MVSFNIILKKMIELNNSNINYLRGNPNNGKINYRSFTIGLDQDKMFRKNRF